MSLELPPHVVVALQELVPREEITSAVLVQQSFGGVVQRVTVGGREFVVKYLTPPQDDFNLVPAFRREFAFYSKVFPALTRFLEEKGVKDGFLSVPKCHKIVCDAKTGAYLILLEAVKGCRPLPLAQPAGQRHAELVLEQLAKLHGASFAYQAQRKDKFEEFEQLTDPLFPRMAEHEQAFDLHLGKVIDQAIEALDSHEVFRKEKLLQYRTEVLKALHDYLDPEPIGQFACIGHGDCWAPNLLFNDPADPSQVVLVDFQICRFASPVLDVATFLFTSTTEAIRGKAFPGLLKFYHSTLAEQIRRLGSDPEEIYPWSVFQQQMKRVGGFGLIMAMMQLPSYLGEAAAPPKPAPRKGDEEKIEEGTVRKLVKTTKVASEHPKSLLDEQLSAAIRDVIRLGYI